MARRCALAIVAIGAAAVLLLGLVRWETMVVQYHLWRVRNDPEVLADLIQTEDRLALKALNRFFRTEAGNQALAEHFYDCLVRTVNDEADTDYPAQLKLDEGLEVSLSFRLPTDHRFNRYGVTSSGGGSFAFAPIVRTSELNRVWVPESLRGRFRKV